MTNIDRARSVIETVRYFTLSTVDEAGLPWNAPVFGVYDQEYNLYWSSYLGSQHSKNILHNGRVMVVIYDSTVAPGDGLGVYIRAEATHITDDSKTKATLSMLQVRHESSPYWQEADLAPGGPIGIFMARPSQVWINSEGESNGSYVDIRTEVSLLADCR